METDVLIVGGGLSGLALADHLARRRTDFRLVEAQNRLGGRVLTKTLGGGAFDMGPAWFWPGQPRMADLAQRFEIPVFEQFSTGDLVFQDQTGAVQRGRGFASMVGSFRLSGGMGRLIDALSNTLDPSRVLTETRLAKVDTGANRNVAHLTQQGVPLTIEANHVVLALPPRVIAETLAFEPPLSAASLQVLQDVPTWMAGQAKIIAVYDAPHWRDAGLSGDAMSQRGPVVEIHDASPDKGGPYALFGFVGVPPEVRQTHKDDMMQLALSQLIALFGPEMAEPRELILKDWALVPEIARAADRKPLTHHPSYGLPASLQSLSSAGIHFGSTETAPEFGGYLEGALEAAERVADALAR